jgi:GT2 family glycosyltransferase
MTASARIPLSALRSRLDAESEGTRWTIHPDGVLGRALVCDADAALTVPLRLTGPIVFTARAMLLPHDWRDRHGSVRAWVAVTNAHGHRRELSSAKLQASDRGRPRGQAISVELPADSTAVTLGVSPLPATGDAPPSPPLQRAIFLDPTIIDPNAPEITPTPAPPEPSTTTAEHTDRPLISVLVPVHDPPLHMLQEAIASVTNQTFPDWELCLVDDGSSDPEITAALTRHTQSDPRIHLTRHEHAQGISTATNAALAMATGTYIALLDHDDTLTPDALQHIADRITTQPDLDMIYTDEDTVAQGRRLWVHLKPAWSPDTLRTNGYTCHLGVYRRRLVNEIGAFRTEFNGSQDVDMILRLVERTDRIAHIPRILYHWRAHAASTAGGDQAKPYAYVAARNAIAAHVERAGLDAEVGYGPPGLYRVSHRVPASITAEIILTVDEPKSFVAAVRSWQAQHYEAWRVTALVPNETAGAIAEELGEAHLAASQVRLDAWDPDGDEPERRRATALAGAASASTADYIVFMQSPAIGLTHEWLTRLIGYSSEPGIAAAGPVLLAPDGRIEQAGIALPEGFPLHLLHATRSSMDRFFGYGTSVYNLSAVSGILATSRETFDELGGLDPAYGELSLIEYCLRATRAGQRIVIVPDARLQAAGPDSTVNDLATLWSLRQAWARHHTYDPYYNPNYRSDRGDFELAGR